MKWEYIFDNSHTYLTIKRIGLKEKITINILDYTSIWNIEDIKKFLYNRFKYKFKDKIRMIELKEKRKYKLKKLKLLK